MHQCCLRTADHNGISVIFLEAQRAFKAQKHPELRNPEFVSGRVKTAIQEPSFVFKDLAQPGERCVHYLKEFEMNGRSRYTKVVIDAICDPREVVTAFRPDYVKEQGKTDLLYGHIE